MILLRALWKPLAAVALLVVAYLAGYGNGHQRAAYQAEQAKAEAYQDTIRSMEDAGIDPNDRNAVLDELRRQSGGNLRRDESRPQEPRDSFDF